MPSDTHIINIDENDAVDLHLHTVVYDGFWTPETLVDYTHQQGFRVIAVADHDSTANVNPTRELAAKNGIAVLPAVEVTARFDGVVQHLLLYGVDINDPAFLQLLGDLRQAQIASAERGLAEFRRRGLDLPHLEAIVAGRSLMPFYVVLALLKAAHAKSYEEAVDLGRDLGIDFDIAVDMAEAIRVAHRQGALAILAHPGRAELGYSPATFERIEGMMAIGLDGLEVYHGLHGEEDIARYGQFAAEHGLMVSCGSDSHGPKSRTRPTPWPAGHCRRLLEAVGFAVRGSRPITERSASKPSPAQECP